MKDIVTRALRARKVLIGRDFYQPRQLKCSSLTFGKRYAEWTFCPDHPDEFSVVYSFGVGEDVSFDLELIEHFKLQVHAFDPSPRSVEWVQGQHFKDAFHFHAFGLAARDGNIPFSEPVRAGIHSLRISDTAGKEESGAKTQVLPVHRLSTILKQLGHDRIDLLKMDIEGAEYAVIDDIIGASVPVTQVLIEFHHRFERIGIEATRRAISKLNNAGYRIFHVSASGEEISFIKTDTA